VIVALNICSNDRPSQTMPPSGIAHKEVAPVTLYTPSNCDHCGKFIWGLHKQAETCTGMLFGCVFRRTD